MSPLDTNTLVKLDKNRFFEDNVIIVLDKLFDIANIGLIMRTASAHWSKKFNSFKKNFFLMKIVIYQALQVVL